MAVSLVGGDPGVPMSHRAETQKFKITDNILSFVQWITGLNSARHDEQGWGLLMWSARFSSPNEKKKGRPILFNDLYIT
jgi:hypothetical protein